MSTKLIAIRHGFSVANKLQVFTGQSNIELTDVGYEQARLCGEFFDMSRSDGDNVKKHGINKIDAIYASDLCRTRDTAMPIAKALGMETEMCEGLREIYAGDWEMMPFKKIDEVYAEEYSVWKNDIGRAACTGGESVSELFERVQKTVCDIAKKHDGGVVVIVTHATPIRVLCTLSRGISALDMGRVPWVSNASVNIFEFDGEWHEIETNITSHLGSLKTDLPRGV